MDTDELQAIVDYQREFIQKQQSNVDIAITLLEQLVLEEDTDPDKVEQIIQVLTSD